MSTHSTSTQVEVQIGYAVTCTATLQEDERKTSLDSVSPSEKWFAANHAQLKELALDNVRSLCGEDTLPVTDS